MRGARTVAEDGITDKGNFVLQTIEDNAVRRMSRSMDDLQGERWIGFQTDNVTIIKILCSVQIDISVTIGTQVPAGVRQVFFSITMDAVGDVPKVWAISLTAPVWSK